MTKTTKRIVLRLGALLLATVLTAMALIPAAAASGYDFPEGAVPVRVTLDGKEVLEGEAVIIQSVTYVPLRSFSELAGADTISWNAKTGTATVKKGSTSVSVTDGGYYLVASGRYFYTDQRVLNIGNRLFVPIRPIAKALSVEVEWENATRTVRLTSTNKTLTPASSYYNETDLYWLSRIISAESAGESLYGQIAVGNVVLNRKQSSQFPSTVKGVVFDTKYGVQFSPVSSGTIYNTPTSSAVMAAKICLEGYSLSTKMLYFYNPAIATSSWIGRTRPYIMTIGNHKFYA